MKTFFFLILLLLSSIAFSQGNLQFNQVKLVSTQETVPAGKVWKVESAIFQGGSNFQIVMYTYGSMSYSINGNACYIATTGVNTSSNMPVHDNAFPFWLPAGATLAAGTNMRYLSVLEFNIVQ